MEEERDDRRDEGGSELDVQVELENPEALQGVGERGVDGGDVAGTRGDEGLIFAATITVGNAPDRHTMAVVCYGTEAVL